MQVDSKCEKYFSSYNATALQHAFALDALSIVALFSFLRFVLNMVVNQISKILF